MGSTYLTHLLQIGPVLLQTVGDVVALCSVLLTLATLLIQILDLKTDPIFLSFHERSERAKRAHVVSGMVYGMNRVSYSMTNLAYKVMFVFRHADSCLTCHSVSPNLFHHAAQLFHDVSLM
jgi:hypothetical protein